MVYKILVLSLISHVWTFSQTIENVDFRVEGKSIVVTYDFLLPKADTSVNIELQFKDQQGSVIIPKTISGDLKDVNPGQEKRIVWDVLADGIVLSGKYKAELKIIQYNSVKIGNQVWMTENLNVDRFRNGDPIYEAKTAEEWKRAADNEQPVWCFYDNDPVNGEKYGKLYNWYALIDSRCLAPEGYRIPSDKDWSILLNFIGTSTSIEMKSQVGWNNTYSGTSMNGNNKSGFNGFPGGLRFDDGSFSGKGDFGTWWSCSKEFSDENHDIILDENITYIVYDYNRLAGGCSIRCLKDQFNEFYHVVILGETIKQIAQKYKVNVNEIMTWNNLQTAYLEVGQKLIIRQKI